MSSFTTPLRVESVDETRWKVIEPFVYMIGDINSDDVVIVPSGFITNFASIPRILWSLLPPWGKYGKAAVIHDYLYTVHSYTKVAGEELVEVELTREEADNIFLEAMQVLDVHPVVRYGMWQAVKVFGQSAWDE